MNSGTTISHYRLGERLGSGGMGVVYRAEDLTLGRAVALKFLSRDVASDRAALERFLREARAAAALNHPNICTIHEIGEHDGLPFLAMELLQGRTLRDVLHPAARPLPLDRLLLVGIQIADALEAAHRKGIVHRDIKPSNLFITQRGDVKVMDFGLAKLIEAAEPHVVDGATASLGSSDPHLTSPGMTVGTIAYMSPEQVRGEDVDARSDVFALGAVLYEMATGRVAFSGATSGVIFEAILNRMPPEARQINSAVPPRLNDIIHKALEKETELRYQSAADLGADLKRLRREISTTEPRASESGAHIPMEHRSPTRAPRMPWIALAVVVAFLAIGYAVYRTVRTPDGQPRPPQPPSAAGASRVAPQMQITRLTTLGRSRQAAISPDGKYVVHALEDGGRQSLWVRQVATGSNVQIVPAAEVEFHSITFSGDGNFVYYVAGAPMLGRDLPFGTLYRVPVLGGVAETMTTALAASAAPSPDGRSFAFLRPIPGMAEVQLLIAAADVSAPRIVATRKLPDFFRPGIAWSADGGTLAVLAGSFRGTHRGQVMTVPSSGGALKPLGSHEWNWLYALEWLTDGSGMVVTASDRPTFFSSQLWFVSWPDGKARRITNDLNHYSRGSVTADRNTLATVQSEVLSSIWVAPDGNADRARNISASPSSYIGVENMDWTPDGRIVHVASSGASSDIWITSADGSGGRQLTHSGNHGKLRVSPDGRALVFMSDRSGSPNLWSMNIDGAEQRRLTHWDTEFTLDISPDGKSIVFSSARSGSMELWKMPIEGGDAIQLTRGGAWLPVISPDGKWIACVISRMGGRNIAMIPFEGGAAVKTFELPGPVGWSRDGKNLLYVDRRDGYANLWSQPLDGGKPKQITKFKAERMFNWAWSRDGRQLAVSLGSYRGDVVLIRNFKN